MPSPSTALDSFAVFSNLMSQPERYWPLLMTVTETEKTQLEQELDRLMKSLLDARDPNFQAVFPPDILAQGQHLVFFWLALAPIPEVSTPYRARFLGRCRRFMVGLPSSALRGMDALVGGYLSDPEKALYDQYKRTPRAKVCMEPKPCSYGLWIIQGIYPE